MGGYKPDFGGFDKKPTTNQKPQGFDGWSNGGNGGSNNTAKKAAT